MDSPVYDMSIPGYNRDTPGRKRGSYRISHHLETCKYSTQCLTPHHSDSARLYDL